MIVSTPAGAPLVPDAATLAASTDAIPSAQARSSVDAARVALAAVDSIADAGVELPPGLVGAWTSRSSRSSTARAASPGYATTTKAKSTSTSKAKSDSTRSTSSSSSKSLAFLQDPRLSLEEKLMRLLAYLSADYDKQVAAKMNEMGAGVASATRSVASTSGSAKKKTSTLGSITGLAKQFFPGAGIALEVLKNPAVRDLVSKIGGPILAAGASALGFPALAPLLLKYGPEVADAAAGIASTLADEGAIRGDEGSRATVSGTASGSSSGGSQATQGAAMSDSERQLKLMEIQRLQEKQKEMFTLVSAILRSNHEMRSTIIGNMR